jgi:hypothetical protein
MAGWDDDNARNLVVNAIVWAAHKDVSEEY